MVCIVTDKCNKCKNMGCIEVCPVAAFHEGPNMVVIDPEECIECGACMEACPLMAIKEIEDLDSEEEHFIEMNEEYSEKWPSITEPIPSSSHESWEE